MVSNPEEKICPGDIKENLNIRILNNVGILSIMYEVVTKHFQPVMVRLIEIDYLKFSFLLKWFIK